VEERTVSMRRLGDTITATLPMQTAVMTLTGEALPPDLR
jgi:hypothetical protein